MISTVLDMGSDRTCRLYMFKARPAKSIMRKLITNFFYSSTPGNKSNDDNGPTRNSNNSDAMANCELEPP